MALGHEPLLKPILDSWELNESSSVLDIGCGVGRALWRAQEEGAGSLAGVDIADSMIKQAKELLPYADLHVASVLDLPFENAVFTHALSIEALYYLDEPVNGLTEILRVLKQGAKFSSVIEYFTENIASEVWAQTLPMKIIRWSAGQWEHAFKEAGFTAVSSEIIQRPDPKTKEEFVASDSFPSWEMYEEYIKNGALWVRGKN